VKDGLDRVIHEPSRLRIVSVLAAARELTFPELKAHLDMTDGNLSVHLRTLEEAGYVEVDKEFVGRRPRTTARLTRAGRRAFGRYAEVLARLTGGPP
jgi:DNA-binding transcriptional ArsR family regulator